MNRQDTITPLFMRLDWFSPVILFPIVYIGYIAFGLIPFSNLWYPPPSVLLYFGLGLASYLLGVLVAYRSFAAPASLFFGNEEKGGSPPNGNEISSSDPIQASEEKLQQVLLWVAWTIMGLGLLASLVILASGIPILNPEGRGSTSAAVKMVTNGLWFGLGFTIFLMGGDVNRRTTRAAIHSDRRGQAWLWGWTAASFLILLLIAYRTPLIYLAFMILLWWHYQRRPITLLQLSLFGLALILGATLFGYAREVLTYGIDRWNAYVTGLGISPVWSWLIPSHIVTREGVSVFQELAYVIPQTGGYFSQFHLSSFLSALPGAQDSPRRIVTYLLGNRPEVTTTPSIIGPFYIDFGVVGIVAGMFLLGAALAGVYLTMRQNRGLKRRILAFFYAFLLGITLAGIHTGILDISLYLMLGFCYLLWRFVNIWQQYWKPSKL